MPICKYHQANRGAEPGELVQRLGGGTTVQLERSETRRGERFADPAGRSSGQVLEPIEAQGSSRLGRSPAVAWSPGHPRAARASARRFLTMTSGSTLIVQALDDAPSGLTAAQLAERIDRNPGHVRRILAGLAQEGYVRASDGTQVERVWVRTEVPAPPSPSTARLRVPVVGIDESLLLRLAAAQGRSVVDITSEAIEQYYVAVTGEPIPETPLAS